MRWHPRRASRLGRLSLRLGQTAVPTGRLLRARTDAVEIQPVVLTLVYRARNAAVVAEILRSTPPDSTIALWALDEVAPALASMTLGAGPGSRFHLHEELLRLAAPPPDVHWVLSDDDIVLRRSSVKELVRVAITAHIDVYAPTHAWDSHWSYGFTCSRPLSLVRETSFVEIGPLVGFSPAARAMLLPFPAVAGVGWGMEAYWSSLSQPGLRNGLIDALPIAHTTPVGGTYDQADEAVKAQVLLERSGVPSLEALMRTSATWRPWQRRPPWL